MDSVETSGGGRIGMSACPGLGGDLCRDLDRMRDFGAVAVVTLMEAHELAACGIAALHDAVRDRAMDWYHLPIADRGVPDAAFEQDWAKAAPRLCARLRAGQAIVVHCRAGLGRTGMITARLLMALGAPAEQAMAEVRRARPGTVETLAQEEHLLGTGTNERTRHG